MSDDTTSTTPDTAADAADAADADAATGSEQGGSEHDAQDAQGSSGPAEPGTALLQPLVADDPALRDAPVRIHCPREVRCLWAGPTMPDLSVHPDPAAEVREAAGCLTDPPTCPCAVADQDPATGAAGAADTTSPADGDRAAIDAVAAQAGVALPEPVAALRPALGRPAALGPGLGVGMGGAPGLLTGSVADTVTSPMLLTAEAHGLDGNGRPAPDPVAFGGDVAGVLDALGFDPAAVHTALMGRSAPPRDDTLDTPDLEPAPESDPEHDGSVTDGA